MRVIFFGSGEFGIPTFRSLREDGHEIVAVVSQPDRPAGRGRRLQPTPLKAWAQNEDFSVDAPPDVNASDFVARLRSLNADLAYVASFGQKIGRDILTMFPVGIINLHGSLLPAYRGAAPVQWAVLRGEAETGVTVFRLVEQMDAGPILAQRRTRIGDDETADDLADRLARIGCDCLRGALERLAADPYDPGDPQDDRAATRAPRLKKSDGFIDFARPAREVARRINGLWSWPGAACDFVSADGARRETVTLARAAPCDEPPHEAAPPGVLTPRHTVLTADGEIRLLEIKPAGGRLMDWQSFINGRHVRPGDRFFGPF
jgi:methionyl-tRNA formyltransferase